MTSSKYSHRRRNQRRPPVCKKPPPPPQRIKGTLFAEWRPDPFLFPILYATLYVYDPNFALNTVEVTVFNIGAPINTTFNFDHPNGATIEYQLLTPPPAATCEVRTLSTSPDGQTLILTTTAAYP